MTDFPGPITAEEIRLSKFSLAHHVILAAGGECCLYRCDTFLELFVRQIRSRHEALCVRHWMINGEVFDAEGPGALDYDKIAARLNAGRCRVCRAPHGDLHLNGCPGPEVDDEEPGREAYVQSALMEFDDGEI